MSKSNPSTHTDCPVITKRLKNCPVMWIARVQDMGKITAYATRSGLVAFLDYENHGGWTMLTECPSIEIGANAAELDAMLDDADLRVSK